jgi:hypothetical protein
MRAVMIKNPMYFAIWFGVAAVFVFAPFAYRSWVRHSIESLIRQSLRESKAAGTLAEDLKDIDPDSADFSKVDFQMKLPSGFETRLQLAMWLTEYWYVWAFLVLSICVTLAYLTQSKLSAV